MTTNIIGGYQYDEKIKLGEGAFGKVYKGQHATDATQIVAIKRIEIGALKKNAKIFLEREIKILRELSDQTHPHIVRQLHIQATAAAVYIVMEFCNGGSLQKYLDDRGGRLDERTIKLFLKQIVDGMIVLYQKKIIHRDLKPDNIMLCWNSTQVNPPPSDITLKIVDFGIGRFLLEGEIADTQCGTHGYWAPEIILNSPLDGYNHKVDLWSIGIIIRQCITGEVEEKFHVEDVEPPPNCSEELKDLLRHLLRRDPSRRIDYNGVLRHKFLGNTINVSVEGPRKINVLINENDSVDSLIKKVSDSFNIAGNASQVYLIHASDAKSTLEYGSGQSLSDVGIKNCSSISFCVRQPGGIKDVATG